MDHPGRRAYSVGQEFCRESVERKARPCPKSYVPRTVPKGASGKALSPAPGPGVKAPEIVLRRDGGGSVFACRFRWAQRRSLFYPRADTTGCTREALDFSRLKGAFACAEPRSSAFRPALDPFKSKHKLTIALVSDDKTPEAYGVAVGVKIHGHRPRQLPDRAGPTYCARVA